MKRIGATPQFIPVRAGAAGRAQPPAIPLTLRSTKSRHTCHSLDPAWRRYKYLMTIAQRLRPSAERSVIESPVNELRNEG